MVHPLSRLPGPCGLWLSSDCGPAEHRDEVVAHEANARLEATLPVLADRFVRGRQPAMGRVIVGVDPHKRSVTIEPVDDQGRVLATGRFGSGGLDCTWRSMGSSIGSHADTGAVDVHLWEFDCPRECTPTTVACALRSWRNAGRGTRREERSAGVGGHRFVGGAQGQVRGASSYTGPRSVRLVSETSCRLFGSL